MPASDARSISPNSPRYFRSASFVRPDRPRGEDFGIDQLRLRFTVRRESLDEVEWKQGFDRKEGQERTGQVFETTVKARWGLQVYMRATRDQRGVRTGLAHVTVQFNPARACRGPAWRLCPAGRPLDMTVREVSRAVGEIMRPEDPVGDWEVMAIHVARNLKRIPHPGVTLLALRPMVRVGPTRNLLYSQSTLGVPQGLVVGTKTRGNVVVYDKHWQLVENDKGDPDIGREDLSASKGLMRGEVQARQPWAAKYGDIQTVKDITERSIRKLFDDRIRWSKMDATYMTRVDAMDLLDEYRQRNGRPLSYEDRWKVLRYLSHRMLGRETEVSEGTRAKYRQLTEEIGVGSVLVPGIRQGPYRLDFEKGTEVPADTS